ncbi:hypothetical protein ACQEVF_55130 [Nonomuraea polychroma]|uniref:hypothetical protein n=1 Tax=Nonomuraea polychroma TaxID=46176 RepID=UPI003D8C46A5
MILISAGLVLAAFVLLIAGFVLAKPFLIMWSIVVSVLSALFLVIGAFLRRHELFPGGGRAAAPATPPAGLMPPGSPYNQTGPVAHQPPPQPPQRTVTVPAAAPRRPPAGGLAPDAIVLVIPGRKRYHMAGCRQLAGREHEQLTHEEAREEGFTPCTTCLPDAALGGRQLPPAADPEPAAASPSAFAVESRAETAAETRDLRPPVAPPKPDTKASTPGPEPAASHEEGAAGWFGRPAAASAGQAPSAAASESEEEQAETQTSIFRPPPYALRPESPSPGAASRPPSGEPSQASGRPSSSATTPPAGGTSEPSGKPSQSSGEPSRPGGPSTSGAAGEAGTPADKGGSSTGKGERPADETERSADRPGQGAGKATASEGKTEPSLRRPGPPAPSAGKPGTPGGGSGETVATLRQPGRPVRPESAAAEDDDPGPSTAPQPRVPSSAAPPRPGASGGSAGPSQRPSGAARTFGQAEPEEAAVLERPASSAESEAKPKGPLPPGSATFARPSKERPPGMGAGPSASGAKADPPRSGAPAKPQASGPKIEATGSKGGDEPAAGAKSERPGTVKVIVGTRRYHSAACPLIKGAGETGVETMTLAAAEAAGLTSCSVCQHDRETVS